MAVVLHISKLALPCSVKPRGKAQFEVVRQQGAEKNIRTVVGGSNDFQQTLLVCNGRAIQHAWET